MNYSFVFLFIVCVAKVILNEFGMRQRKSPKCLGIRMDFLRISDPDLREGAWQILHCGKNLHILSENYDAFSPLKLVEI